MRLIDADRLLDRCIFYHLPNGDLAVPIIDVQHAPTVKAPDINVGNIDAISRTQAIDAFETAAKGGASIEDIKLIFENLPSVQPDTTTHDSIPAETGKNDGVGTSGDCISRQQAIDALKEKVFRNLTDEFYGAMQVLDELPSIQPERKTGHWIEMSSANHTYKCSECGRLLVNVTDGKNNISKHYPYCHCGAKMEGGEQDGMEK